MKNRNSPNLANKGCNCIKKKKNFTSILPCHFSLDSVKGTIAHLLVVFSLVGNGNQCICGRALVFAPDYASKFSQYGPSGGSF